MPLYDFECDTCGYTGEEIIPFKESKKLIPCPRCNNISYRKIVSKISIGSVEPEFGAIVNGKFVAGSFEK